MNFQYTAKADKTFHQRTHCQTKLGSIFQSYGNLALGFVRWQNLLMALPPRDGIGTDRPFVF
jgi:hypothetical protein